MSSVNKRTKLHGHLKCLLVSGMPWEIVREAGGEKVSFHADALTTGIIFASILSELLASELLSPKFRRRSRKMFLCQTAYCH